MYFFNEQNKQLSFQEAKAELQALPQISTPSIAEVQIALGDYYSKAMSLQAGKLQVNATVAPLEASISHADFLGGIGGKILAEIKKSICAVLSGSSTEDQILQAVLSALATILPGGIFIKTLANIIVKYLLSTGVTAFCNNPAIPSA